MNANTWALVIGALLLAANAFFVGAEFALVSARRSQIEPHAEAGSRRARRTLGAMERVSVMMAGAQLGITVCSLGLGALAEPALAHLLETPMETAGLPEGAVHPVAFAIALSIVVALHVVLGEMVPKNLALAAPQRAALALGPSMAAAVRAAGPVITGINGLASLLLRAVRVRPTDEVASAYDVHGVAQLAEESHREGLLDDEEYELMARALAFTATTAADLQLSWERLVTVTAQATVAEVEALAGRSRHLRFPALDAGGRPVGYVHAKDLLRASGPDRRSSPVAPLVRRMPTVSAETSLPDVLTVLREARAPMAGVRAADGVSGVVTLDDVVMALIRAGAPDVTG